MSDENGKSNGSSVTGPGWAARLRALWHAWHLGALLTHVGLSVLFTWPLVLNFLPGTGPQTPGTLIVDRDQNLWNLWWVRQAVTSGQNPFVTTMIYYPTPISLYYHTLNLFNGLLAVVLLGFLSLTTTYNLIVLFSFVVGGYGAFLLVHYLCGNRWAALVGSVVFAYSAYHLATMRGLLQMISLEWVPFFVLALLWATFRPGWRGLSDVTAWLLKAALPAALMLFLISLVDWYYTMYAAMLAGLLALYILVRYLLERAARRAGAGFWQAVGQPWIRIGVCLGIYLVLIAPILVPTVRELRSSSYMLPAPDAATANSADLLAFVEPPRGHAIWGRAFTNRDEWPYGSNQYEVYLTYTAIFLALVGLFATRLVRPGVKPVSRLTSDGPYEHRLPGKWFWATCALIFFLLALGPVLQINGNRLEWLFTPGLKIPMPYGLIEQLPVLNISRSPDRFDMPLTLCLGVLAGYGTNVLAGSWRRGLAPNTRGFLLSTGIVALLALELAPFPYPQRPAEVPRWYTQLGKETGDFSVLELPPQDEYWHGAYRMYFQTEHGKRIFGGYISREYEHPFLVRTSGYQELVSQAGESDIFADGPSEWLSALAQYNTRYVILQKDRLPDRVERQVDVSAWRDPVKRVLGPAQPVYSDEQLEAYRVPSPAARVPFLSLGDGWQPRETGPNGTFRWMGQKASLRIDSPTARQASLTFRASGLGPARTLQVFQGERKVFEQQVGPLQDYTIAGLPLDQGATDLDFVSPQGTLTPAQLGMGNDRRQLSFAVMKVAIAGGR